jgi:hypothetical protein
MSPFYWVKLGDNATTTHRKLQQDFGDDALSRAQVLSPTVRIVSAVPLSFPLSLAQGAKFLA